MTVRRTKSFWASSSVNLITSRHVRHTMLPSLMCLNTFRLAPPAYAANDRKLGFEGVRRFMAFRDIGVSHF
jgi:hypothetical protein